MKNLNLVSYVLFLALLSLTACKNDNSVSGADASSLAASTDPNGGTGVSPDGTPAPTGPATTVEYTDMVYDFGEIVEGEHVNYAFRFKNTGGEPLIISDAKGSCGCTVPDWPREPIAPGGSGEIKIEFDSKGKGSDDGQKQTKKVTVTANTNPPQTYLTITGVVKKDPKAAKAAPGGNPSH
jgi:hypothetical protein